MNVQLAPPVSIRLKNSCLQRQKVAVAKQHVIRGLEALQKDKNVSICGELPYHRGANVKLLRSVPCVQQQQQLQYQYNTCIFMQNNRETCANVVGVMSRESRTTNSMESSFRVCSINGIHAYFGCTAFPVVNLEPTSKTRGRAPAIFDQASETIGSEKA